jgi:chaperonin GroES
MEDIMIKPLADRIVIKIIDDVQQTSGGIFIPDSAKEKSQKGKVVAVGPGKTLDSGELEKMEVKENDIVLFAKYAGTDVKFGDKTVKILSVRDVLGIVEE